MEENETFTEEIDLEKLFGVLDTGKYKIKKEINLEKSRVMVSAEFKID